ncbi:hypothetical protein [Paractinoplanes ferrugineus]|nr:hypothetical protein [Actinoplanes ferrugineus]
MSVLGEFRRLPPALLAEIRAAPAPSSPPTGTVSAVPATPAR